jgi:OmpA-OmpF porin, OOP family
LTHYTVLLFAKNIEITQEKLLRCFFLRTFVAHTSPFMKNFLFVIFSLICTIPFASAQHSEHLNAFAFKYLSIDHETPQLGKLANRSFYTNGLEVTYLRHIKEHFSLAIPFRYAKINVHNSTGALLKNQPMVGMDIVGQWKSFQPNQRFAPYLLAGIGGTIENYKNLDIQLPVGVGFNLKLGSKIYLNAQTQYRFSQDHRRNLQHGVGLLFLFDKLKKNSTPAVVETVTPVLTDTDGDGVPDAEDSCPDEKGLVLMNGCPDTDGDKIPDNKDRCPNEVGTIAAKGCPDKDRDGVADKDDKCPDKSGPAGNKGCPIADEDGDGITDDKDDCPNSAGPAATKGCPDRDSDGVVDKNDACPDDVGLVKLDGCPDKDEDGIQDDKDKCPDKYGYALFDGCPPPAKKPEVVSPVQVVQAKQQEQAKQDDKDKVKQEDKDILARSKQRIQFETSKATLLKTSYSTLDQIVKVMQKYPKYKIRISGHTDNVGDERKNLRLSELRAKACADYMVRKGIPSIRITFIGQGQTMPIADNKTKIGRDQNRRVEFELFKEGGVKTEVKEMPKEDAPKPAIIKEEIKSVLKESIKDTPKEETKEAPKEEIKEPIKEIKEEIKDAPKTVPQTPTQGVDTPH